jgi:hypothetical protein
VTTETFKGLPVLRKTTVDKANLPPLLIYPSEWVDDGVDNLGLPKVREDGGMEEYSGWDYAEHLKWVRDLTKLPIPDGSILAVNEDCSEVWLLARNHYKATCRLIHRE